MKSIYKALSWSEWSLTGPLTAFVFRVYTACRWREKKIARKRPWAHMPAQNEHENDFICSHCFTRSLVAKCAKYWRYCAILQAYLCRIWTHTHTCRLQKMMAYLTFFSMFSIPIVIVHWNAWCSICHLYALHFLVLWPWMAHNRRCS